MTRAYRPLLKELGITYPQFLVLLVLWEHGSVRLGEIAEDLQLATHAVSPIIDRLEEVKLVRRVRDEGDGRAVLVELTKRGAGLEAVAVKIQSEIRDQTSLDPDSVRSLRTQLHDLVEKMNES